MCACWSTGFKQYFLLNHNHNQNNHPYAYAANPYAANFHQNPLGLFKAFI